MLYDRFPRSTTICFPLETVRTRMAVSRSAYRGIVDCFRKTGPGALYRVSHILSCGA